MRSPSLPAGRVNLQAGPTFCFSRKQFTTFCKKMSLLFMTTFLHINGLWEKSSCLGLHRGLCLPTWLHPAASKPCINWTEQPSDSLRKQPTFFNTTTGFPVKWRLRNDCRNFILLRCQYPVLGSASDWSRTKGNCNQKHYSDLGSDTGRRQYEISAVTSKRHFRKKSVVASPNFGCFLKRPLRLLSQIKILTIEAKEKVSS